METTKNFLPLVLIFILMISVRIYWVCQKDYVFVDEPLSFSIISPNTFQDGKPFKTFDCAKFNFKENSEYTAKEIRGLLFNNGGNFKSLIKDLKMLYLHHYDGGHSNLYYMLLRIWAFNLDDVGVSTINFYGFTFNLLLFSISFFIMFKILQLIIDDKKYIPSAIFLSFISTLSVSAVLLAREYQFQTLGMLIATYIFCTMYLWIVKNKNLDILNGKSIFIYSLAFSFYFLTGYYSLIYAFLLFLILSFTIYKNIKVQKTDLIKVLSMIICSVIFVFVVDINYLSMSQDFVKASNNTFLSLKIFERELFTAFDMMQKTIFYPILLVYILVLSVFLKIKDKEYSLCLIVFLVSFLWSLTVLLIAPFYDIRYFMPAAPLLSLGFIYILQLFKFKHTIIFCLISFLFILIPNTRFNNFDTVRPFLFYVHDHNGFVFKNPYSLPIVFRDYQHTVSSFVLYSEDNQKILFVDNIPDKNFKYKAYILFFKKDNLNKYQESLKNLNIISSGYTKFYDYYVIVNNK